MTKTHLNTLLADLHVLQAKLYHFHWYVKGEQFFTLHEQFERGFEETRGFIDEVAERNLQIGGKPLSSMSQYIEAATLKEETKELAASEMVAQLIADYQLLTDQLQTFITTAAAEGDFVTEDFFVEMSRQFQKNIWMYRSFLRE